MGTEPKLQCGSSRLAQEHSMAPCCSQENVHTSQPLCSVFQPLPASPLPHTTIEPQGPVPPRAPFNPCPFVYAVPAGWNTLPCIPPYLQDPTWELPLPEREPFLTTASWAKALLFRAPTVTSTAPINAGCLPPPLNPKPGPTTEKLCDFAQVA